MKLSHVIRKGFTLIELLVVIAIIGLLTSIVLVSLEPARARARDAKRQGDIRQISSAMELCYEDATCGAGKTQYVATAGGANAIANIDTDQSPCPLCPVPTDPTNVTPQQYTWSNNTAVPGKYCVYTKSESENVWVAASEKGARNDLTAAPPATLNATTSCW